MDLAQILDLIRQHGDAAYGFVFAYAASNSMLMPLFAGYAAHQNVFDWGTLVLVCAAGSFAGDTIRFWIGRRYGPACANFFPRAGKGIDIVLRLIDRHHLWMLLAYRYPHGVRGVAGFAFGMSKTPWPRFLVINAVSAVVWAVTLVSIGYSFGHVSEKTLGETASTLSLGILVLFLALGWYLSKRLDRVIERESRNP